MDKGEEQDNPTLFEIMKEDPDITYNEATRVQEDLRLKKEGVCITGALKKDLSKVADLSIGYWKDMYEKEHKIRRKAEQWAIKNTWFGVVEAEGENTIIKGKEIDYHRYWKDMYDKEHKLRLEAQGETTIVKGIGMNSPEMKDAQHRIKELDNSLSIALEINEKHQRYNGKLQTRVTDLEEDNKKLTKQINDHIKNREDIIRKAGL